MTNNELVKALWDASNLITAFVAVQGFAFVYACAKKEFGDKINQKLTKRIIFIVIAVNGFGIGYAIYWCARQMCRLDQANCEIFYQSSIGRIIFVIVFVFFTVVMLYARQLLRKQPFNA